MALHWMDGFDHYGVDNAALAQANMLRGVYAAIDDGFGYCAPVTTRSRTGGASLRVGGNGPLGGVRLRRVLNYPVDVLVYGAALWVDALPSSNGGSLVQFSDYLNGLQLSFVLESGGQIAVYRGANNGTLLGRSSLGDVVASAWQHLEFKALVHPTEGAVEVRVNGVTVFSVSGVNTQNSGNTNFGNVRWASSTAPDAGVLPNHFWDDVYVCDNLGPYNNDFLGDKRVGILFPDDDTPQSDWTPTGSLTGFGAINENPQNGDTTYISTIDAGNVSEFEIQDITADIGVISAVQVMTLQRKTVAGTCNTQVSMGSGASYGRGADRPITEQYTYYSDIFEEDPDTNAPWTKSGLNAATVSIERKS